METLINQYKQIVNELLKQSTLNFDGELSKILPKKPGIYRIFEKVNPEKPIYIGKGKSLQRRIVGDHYKGLNILQ